MGIPVVALEGNALPALAVVRRNSGLSSAGASS